MAVSQVTYNLPLLTCLFLDLPDSLQDCSTSHPGNDTENIGNVTETCISCWISSKFITGKGMDQRGTLGHAVLLLLWILTLVIGVGGTLGNYFIVLVLKRHKDKTTAFDILLGKLAWIDMMCCAASVVMSTATVVYFENWSRSVPILYILGIVNPTGLMMRTASSFMTVVISFERYMAIAYPLLSRRMMSYCKNWALVTLVVLLSLLLAIPKYTEWTVEEIPWGRDIESLKEYSHLVLYTRLGEFWNGTMKNVFYLLALWLPLILLLVFNGLVHLHALRYVRQREDMGQQRKEIRAVKMFVPVVIVLLVSNVVPVLFYPVFIQLFQVAYRELYLATVLSYAFNSAANLFIYYYKWSMFREEAMACLGETFPRLKARLGTGSNRKKSNGTESYVVSA